MVRHTHTQRKSVCADDFSQQVLQPIIKDNNEMNDEDENALTCARISFYSRKASSQSIIACTKIRAYRQTRVSARATTGLAIYCTYRFVENNIYFLNESHLHIPNPVVCLPRSFTLTTPLPESLKLVYQILIQITVSGVVI